ncbi:tail fiber protein [Caudoviricetes sp.]|nr:MAG: putative carbohydrate binding domain containing protein [Podoviridae sp. ct2cs2]UOF77526.1 tail fiber protein [Caudoviricetes sp.]
MASIIKSTTTDGIQIIPDSTGAFAIQTNGANTALTIDTSQNATFAGTISSGAITSSGAVTASSITATNTVVMGSSFLRNRIINGDMRVDQRNAGASVTPSSGQYLVDRFYALLTQASKFSVQQNAGSVTPPTGFTNYLGVTSLSSYSISSGDAFNIVQAIEGYNTSDLAWGTANAKTVTFSFWVRSSLAGTFGGSIANDAGSRSYPFTYTISSANTWEQKTITITGDTTGTWNTNNSASLRIYFGLGVGTTYSGTAGTWAGANYVSATGATSVVGTNGATWYITGVQLEIGTSATPFERRLYGQELVNCQRYYWKFTGPSFAGVCAGYSNGTTTGNFAMKYPVTMRSAPTFSTGGLSINNATGNYAVTSVSSGYAGTDAGFTSITTASGLVSGQGCLLTINSAGTGYLDGSSEL